MNLTYQINGESNEKNITDTSFGETDQIANMMISNTCYGSYEASLEKINAL